jgi:hypothetical protein
MNLGNHFSYLGGIFLGYPSIPIMFRGFKSLDDHLFWLFSWFGLTIQVPTLDIVFKRRLPPNNDFTTGEFRGGFPLKDWGGLVYLPEVCGVTR